MRDIFISNINKTPNNKLVEKSSTDPFIRFFGFNTIPHSFVKNREEDIFNFMYRHTFGRPRELVLLGKRIFEMEGDERRFDTIRRKINYVKR